MSNDQQEYFHLYSDGTVRTQLFNDDSDFIFGMNQAAIISHACGVRILCINLMATHFHVLLYGTQKDCQGFASRYAKRLKFSLPAAKGKGRIELSMDKLVSETETLSVFAYVIRNCTSAGYAYLPQFYPWGPGNIFFRPEETFAHGHLVSDMSVRCRREHFGTRLDIPMDWEYDDDGMIMTKFWIDWARVNTLFGSPHRFLAFLYQKKDLADSIKARCRHRLLEDLSQKELRTMVGELSVSMIGKRTADCSLQEKTLVARKIWRSTTGYSLRSIARALKVDPEIMEVLLGN